MRIGKIANSAEYRKDEQFQNCEILVVQIEKKFRNLLIWTISKICNLGNSKDLQFRKFQKIAIWEIRKI